MNRAFKKVHVGCGTVYLDSYINIDLNIPKLSFLAFERPDLVKKNKTTVDKYYKTPIKREDIENGHLNKKLIVVDQFADIRKLPFLANTLDEIRSVQVFEHFTYKEGRKLLEHWHKLLRPRGMLHIDVPDFDETVKGYLASTHDKDKQWYIRLLFGSQKNEFGLHKSMYSKKMLKQLFSEFGFINIKDLGNIHFYPAFALEAIKK